MPVVYKSLGSRNLMKTCKHRKFLERRARGLLSSIFRHHTLQGADSFTRLGNEVENSLITMKISNSVQIRDAICPLAVLSAKGIEPWGRCCYGAR